LAALEMAMEEMARRAMARRADGFAVLAEGSLGTGGFYALGKRTKAWVTGRPYVPEHTPDRTPPDGTGMRKLQEGTPKG